MKKIAWLLLLCMGAFPVFTTAQSKKIDSVRFFTDQAMIDITLTTDIRKLQNQKGEDVFQEASVSCRFPDSSVIEEPVMVAARGHFRREYCNIPPVMIDFSNAGSPKLSPLGKLKLVIGCGTSGNDEQLLIREYLAYKIYNILEPKSFRVRLVKVSYRDTRSKMKAFSQYAFLIEDDNDMAARNGCIKKAKAQYLTENTDRELMTKVAVFEYLISNGDWSVPNNHNTRLIYEKKNPGALPYVVPYDFDHSGFVNASYALPNELLGTETVTERVYRGFPRSMEELQQTFAIFRDKKQAIMGVINNCTYLQSRSKKEVTEYLEEFYKTINDKKQVQFIFIDNARKQ
ncbi:MAG TPA: hypothetical protein VGO58_02110 [Chitinophagaceae bacterium]|nr:hypothetical protein [Chitinophagaceae bacterium]